MVPELVLNPDQRKHRFRRQIAKDRQNQPGQQDLQILQGQQSQEVHQSQEVQQVLETQQDQMNQLSQASQPGPSRHVAAAQENPRMATVFPAFLSGATAAAAAPSYFPDPGDWFRAENPQENFRHLASKKDTIQKIYQEVFAPMDDVTQGLSYEQGTHLTTRLRDRLLYHVTRVCELFRIFASSLR